MNNKSKIEKSIAVFAALFVWQLASMLIGEDVLLVSPIKVLMRLCNLIFEKEFYFAVSFSFLRITAGFTAAVIFGVILAVAAYRHRWTEIFLWPYMSVIKATPVASFIILCLIWLNSSSLPIFISFLMALPIIYTNTLAGFKSTDIKMLQMAEIFRFSFSKKLRYIYLPNIRPHFISACSVSLGLTWKAGIAAEIIGIPSGSIGEKLYSAKLYLATADLFAWTVTIVFISIIFEKIFMKLINTLFSISEDS